METITDGRWEMYEKYNDYTEEELQKYEYDMGFTPEPIYKYRRTNPLISDIERFIEIPGDKEDCICKFYSGGEIIVRGEYDYMCIVLNDLENSINEES